MGFSANSVVTALTYNFKPYVEAEGTTPEPSDDAVRHFQWRLQEISDAIPSGDDLASVGEDGYKAISTSIAAAVAELTAGQPSYDEIVGLPFRIQRLYIEWLRNELTDPEKPEAATKPSLGVVKSGGLITQRAGT